MQRVLIVGCGNPLRSDDGVAWRVAEQVSRSLPSSAVEVMAMHQLMPELAESISRADVVLFVDAAQGDLPGELNCDEIRPQLKEGVRFTHDLSMQALLALTRTLYGSVPLAFSVTVNGACFDHGENLSPQVAKALPGLVSLVRELANQYLEFARPA